ncbi:MAG: DUF2125 domain-containing protein, partial [Pseudomonadota bacterium]
AQAYQPGKVVMEIEGPAVLSLPAGQEIAAQWSSMRSSMTANLEGVDRFSVIGRDLFFKPRRILLEPARLGELQLHARRQTGETVQFAVRAKQVVSDQAKWPEFSSSLLISLEEVYSQLKRRPDLISLTREKGLRGTLDSFEYMPQQGGRLTLSGPIELSKSGHITGQFELKILDAAKLLQAFETIMPQRREQLGQVRSAIRFLPGGTGDKELRLPLNVKDGQLYLGVFQLGKLPPLF